MTPVESALVGVGAVFFGLVVGLTVLWLVRRLHRRRLQRATRRAYKQLAADMAAVQVALGEGLTPVLRRVVHAMEGLQRAFADLDPELRAAFDEERAIDKLYPVDDERP